MSFIDFRYLKIIYAINPAVADIASKTINKKVVGEILIIDNSIIAIQIK